MDANTDSGSWLKRGNVDHAEERDATKRKLDATLVVAAGKGFGGDCRLTRRRGEGGGRKGQWVWRPKRQSQSKC
jgi:hypothetical protein